MGKSYDKALGDISRWIVNEDDKQESVKEKIHRLNLVLSSMLNAQTPSELDDVVFGFTEHADDVKGMKL